MRVTYRFSLPYRLQNQQAANQNGPRNAAASALYPHQNKELPKNPTNGFYTEQKARFFYIFISDQEYIYFSGSDTPPTACYMHSAKHIIPFFAHF